MRRELEHVEIPGEHEARERAWRVVSTAFAEREPLPAPARRRLVPALALAAAAAIAAATVTSPGRALLHGIRETVGVETAQPALFSLPAPGRLLVVSAEHGGVWVVHPDGSKRRLGNYEDAAWSPRGRFVVATTRNELLALDPGGDIRWTLARRDVSWPRWAPSGYRIAYFARSGLRIVAGDGTGDRLLDPHALGVPPAWRPRAVHELAYVSGGMVVLEAVDENRVLWRAPLGRDLPSQLTWSADGRRLLAAAPRAIRVFDDRGRLLRRIPFRGSTSALAAAWARDGHVFAVHLRHDPALPETGRRSEVRLIDADRPGSSRQLFAGSGVFGELAWSPDGRWLLVDWRIANQWLFIRRSGPPKVVAVANISQQFPRPDGKPPDLLVLDRWCCARS